ncbi:MAG TPA: Wzz/FepE/Etk N-terminal domain-containing protein, partial [Pilimelia sp.]|nr:Wzz/FepE/Etk N-terminal domain-containing protein [Pilimelia sp.]
MASSPHVAPVEPDGTDLAAYLRWLRRHWWVVGAGAVVGLAVGAVVMGVRTPVYEATAQVLVRPVDPPHIPNGNRERVNLDTEAQVVRSLVVAERARAVMRSAQPADALARAVTVTVPPNSQVLDITYAAPTAAQAQTGAAAFAGSYLEQRRGEARRRIDVERKALDAQIASATKRLDAIVRQLARLDGRSSAERERALADRTILTDEIRGLNEARNPLVSGHIDPGEVISAPGLPADRSAPSSALHLGSGLAGGLLLGLAAAAVAGRLDRRVRRGRDLTDRYHVPLLMEAPGQLTAFGIVAPGHALAREIGRLRNVLLTVGGPAGRRGRTVLVTGASAGRAATFIVANLAAAYARTGQQVAVLSTVAGSALASAAAGAGGPGLADVLRRDKQPLEALTAVPGLPTLRVLLPGALDADGELPIAAVREVLGALVDRFDHVLVEATAPHIGVEAQALAADTDAVLVVAEAGRTTHKEIRAAV